MKRPLTFILGLLALSAFAHAPAPKVVFTISASGQPAPTTVHFFDNLGRQTGSRLPDNSTVTNSFYLTSLPKKSHGSHTYPAEYSYDSQGRVDSDDYFSPVMPIKNHQ